MATFYLIRHGEPDYDQLTETGFWGFGRAFAPLSALGIKQAELTANDERLKTADILVSSPYTRAMQTASIISRKTGLPINVEMDLHEWIPDRTNRNRTSEEAGFLKDEFVKCKGIYPPGMQMKWETLAEMRARMQRAAAKYAGYNKVILVGHSMAFGTLTYIEEMKPAEIIECTYEAGQAECAYSFY